MAYDPSQDVSSFKESFENEKTRITVSVWSYNGAPNKLQLSRENFIEEQWAFTKLGRMNKSEVESVLPIIIRAVEEM